MISAKIWVTLFTAFFGHILKPIAMQDPRDSVPIFAHKALVKDLSLLRPAFKSVHLVFSSTNQDLVPQALSQSELSMCMTVTHPMFARLSAAQPRNLMRAGAAHTPNRSMFFLAMEAGASVISTVHQYSQLGEVVGAHSLPNKRILRYLNVLTKQRASIIVLTQDKTTSQLIKQVTLAEGSRLYEELTWLFVVQRDTNIQNFIADIMFSFKCNVFVARVGRCPTCVVEISEWYKVTPTSPLRSNQIALWSRPGKMINTEKTIWRRRVDMEGVLLKIAVARDPPFTYINGEGNDVKVRGYFPDLWKVLQTKLNFKTKYFAPRLGSDNVREELFKEMRKNDTDVILYPFIHSNYPNEAEFTDAVVKMRFRMYIKDPDLENLWESFIKPFQTPLWLTTLLALIVIPLVFRFIYKQNRQIGAETQEGIAEDVDYFDLSESFLIVFGTLLQQGADVTPTSMAARIVFWLALMFGVLLFTSYSAALVSNLTVQKMYYPFLTFEELTRSRYTTNVVQNQVPHQLLQESKIRGAMALYKAHLENNPANMVPDLDVGLVRVSQKKGIALFGIHERIIGRLDEMGKDIKCRLVAVPTDFFVAYGSFALKKGFPFKDVINFYLKKMFESGQAEKMRMEWWMTSPIICSNDEITSLHLEHVSLVIWCLLFGLGLSIIILCFEKALFSSSWRKISWLSFSAKSFHKVKNEELDQPHTLAWKDDFGERSFLKASRRANRIPYFD